MWILRTGVTTTLWMTGVCSCAWRKSIEEYNFAVMNPFRNVRQPSEMGQNRSAKISIFNYGPQLNLADPQRNNPSSMSRIGLLFWKNGGNRNPIFVVLRKWRNGGGWLFLPEASVATQRGAFIHGVRRRLKNYRDAPRRHAIKIARGVDLEHLSRSCFSWINFVANWRRKKVFSIYCNHTAT